MNIPDYPNHLRPCSTVRQAVEILLKQEIPLKDVAIVHYVSPRNQWPPVYGDYGPRSAFSYNFFSPEGRNVGTYIPGMDSFQFQSGSDGRGRQWGIKSEDLVEYRIDITPPVKICRLCGIRPVTDFDGRCSDPNCVPF